MISNIASASGVSYDTGVDDEEYDTFDEEAAMQGAVNLNSMLQDRNMRQTLSTRANLQALRTQAPEKPPAKEGALDKYSPAIFKRWQTRQVELKDGIFKYSKLEKGQYQVMGTLNFDLYWCKVEH